MLRFEPTVQGLETANARGELRVLPGWYEVFVQERYGCACRSSLA